MTKVWIDLDRRFLRLDGTGPHIDPDASRYVTEDLPNWSAVLDDPVAVVLGEAGSGKTVEFGGQARCYLRERGCRRGILLLCNADPRARWQPPGGTRIGFIEVVALLDEQARRLATDSVHTDSLRVIGIDFSAAPRPGVDSDASPGGGGGGGADPPRGPGRRTPTRRRRTPTF